MAHVSCWDFQGLLLIEGVVLYSSCRSVAAIATVHKPDEVVNRKVLKTK